MFESSTKRIWWLPSFGFFLFLFIEFWMFAPAQLLLPSPSRMFSDPGVGRHLRTSEYILETGKIPRTDPLSFTHAGEPWIDFEWGFETALGELYRVGGLGLICAFCYAIFAATILGIYRTLLQTGSSLLAVLLYTLLALLTLQIHFSARPVLVTYLFLTFVVEVWRRRTQPLKRDWLFLPLIFAAWANLHAGWLAALAFLALSMFGRLLDRFSARVDGDEAPLIPWIGLTLLCALATLLNPWGWALQKQVFHVATGLKSAAIWDEYLPPNFSVPTMSALAVLFIVGVIFLARVCKNAPLWRWEIAVPILFFLYEGLKAQRHVLLLMIVAAVPVARDLEVLLRAKWWPWLRERLRNFQEQQRLAGADAWLAILAAAACAFLFMHTPRAARIHVGGNVSSKLVEFLSDHPDRLRRPLTTTWNAGPLLWNMRPDFRVSFDDRGDFYGDNTVFSFVDMMNGTPGWDEKLKKGNYDSLILDPYLELNQLLRFAPDWKLVYRDEHAMVYWRAN